MRVIKEPKNKPNTNAAMRNCGVNHFSKQSE